MYKEHKPWSHKAWRQKTPMLFGEMSSAFGALSNTKAAVENPMMLGRGRGA